MKSKPATPLRMTPLIVNSRTRRFFALVDQKDGTLWCLKIGTEFGDHDEITLYTSLDVAECSAAYERLHNSAKLKAIEVVVSVRKELKGEMP